jgi:macrolide transport system ATP-binding/permease protein
MQLVLSHITYTYPGSSEPALRDVSVTFPQGWTGIVGDNGGGKTTLACVACGLRAPDAGSVAPRLVTFYCAQDATERPANLEDFALAYDGLAVALRRDLGIGEEWAWAFDELSGGQQKRLQVACALWARPDVLAMDEPTNHVDAATRRAIARALSRFKGIGLLVSHDRALLDEVCAQCLFVTRGTAALRPGGYTQASGQAALERESAVRARREARKEKARVERETQRRREAADRAAAGRSGRGLNKHDSDAREKRMRYLVSGQDGKAGKLSAAMETRLAAAGDQLARAHVDKRYEGDIWVDAQPSRRPVLFRMEPQTVRQGDFSLEVPALSIGSTDRIGLVGDNGSGKSTLVKRIVGEIGEAVRCLYIPQEPTLGEKRAAAEELRGLPSDQRGRALSIVAQLNSDPARLLEGGEASPGEMRKLMLALGILRAPELIVMDEPTNHLDIGSTEALERLLAAWPGALLLVSHDAALVQASTATIWRTQPAPAGFRLVCQGGGSL